MTNKLPQPPKDFLISKIQQHLVPALLNQVKQESATKTKGA